MTRRRTAAQLATLRRDILRLAAIRPPLTQKVIAARLVSTQGYVSLILADARQERERERIARAVQRQSAPAESNPRPVRGRRY
jgi:CRP-like cAMP-binding protein